jgi:hypothetical protein
MAKKVIKPAAKPPAKAAKGATQRDEDIASGYPVDKSMKEDPAKRGIPLFLQTQNRKPLTPAQQAEFERRVAQSAGSTHERVKTASDYLKPKGMSWDEWDAWWAIREAEKRAKTEARVAELRAKHPPRERGPKKPRGIVVEPTMVIKVAVKGNPYKAGSAGNKVFAKYKSGMTVAALEKAAAGLTGGRTVVDMLKFDVRKGRITLEALPAKSPKK